MTTKHIVSVQVATEATFGSVAAATGIPSASGLTFSTLELADRAQITVPGEPTLVERMDARTGLYSLPPEPASVRDGSGDMIPRRTGTLTMDTPWRPIGDASAFATWPDMAWFKIMRTGMDYRAATSASDVVASGTSVNEWVPTAGASFVPGDLVRYPKSGRHEYTGVTFRSVAPAIKCSPALSATPSAPEVMYPMGQLYIPPSGTPTGTSACIILDGDGWRAICYGCEITAATMTVDETGRYARWSVTMSTAFVEYDHASASPVATVYADGSPLHQLQSYLVVGSPGWSAIGGPVAPATEGRVALCADAVTLQIDWTRAASGCGGSIIGMGASEVTDVAVSLDVYTAPVVDTYDADLWETTSHNVMLGLSGGAPGAVGEGGCVFIPAAFLTVDAGAQDAGKDYLRTHLTWSAGPYGGDNSPVDDTGNSILRIGLA